MYMSTHLTNPSVKAALMSISSPMLFLALSNSNTARSDAIAAQIVEFARKRPGQILKVM